MNINALRLGYAALAVCVVLLLVLIGKLHSQAAEDAKHIQLVKSETRSYELLHANPPKHFYVDIKDVNTGEVFKRVYVSKHCNSWRKTAVVGKSYQILVHTYRDDRTGVQSKRYGDLYSVFCA